MTYSSPVSVALSADAAARRLPGEMRAARGALALAALLAGQALADKCAVATADGQLIDLLPLAGDGDYTVDSDRKYYLSLCKSLQTEVYHVDNASKVGSYTDGTSLGEWTDSPELLPADAGAVLRYNNGAICPANNNERITSTLIFDCDRDPNLPERPLPVKIPVADECTYVFLFRTPQACPNAHTTRHHRMGFFGFVFLLFFLWIGSIGGLWAYQRFGRGEKGAEAVRAAFVQFNEGLRFAKVRVLSLKTLTHAGHGADRRRDGVRSSVVALRSVVGRGLVSTCGWLQRTR